MLRPYLFLALGMAFTGATVAISKPLASVMPIFLLGLLRCLIAAAALAPFMLKNRQATFHGLGQVRGPLIGQTITGVVLFTCFLFFGVRHSTALSAGIITATLPAAVALLSFFWLKERLSRAQALAIGLAILGVILLNFVGGTSAAGDGAIVVLGTLLLVCAVVAEAFYTIYAKQTAAHLAPLPTAFLVNVIGALCFLPFGLWQGLSFDWALADTRIWLLIFAFAIGSSIFALVFWYIGVKHVKANVAGLFTAVVPLSAGTIALVFLGERLSLFHVIGAGLVIGAIILGGLNNRGGSGGKDTSPTSSG